MEDEEILRIIYKAMGKPEQPEWRTVLSSRFPCEIDEAIALMRISLITEGYDFTEIKTEAVVCAEGLDGALHETLVYMSVPKVKASLN